MADNTGLFGDGMMGGYGNNITAANIIRARARQPVYQAAMENAEPNSSIRNVPDNPFQAWLKESGQRIMNPTDTIAQGVQNFTQQDPVDMGMSLLNGGMGGALGATVWHGSPYKFAKFDPSKMGTGEGAQAYGHGHYLAEHPDVAKYYSPRDYKFEDQISKLSELAQNRNNYPAAEIYDRYLTHDMPHQVQDYIKQVSLEGTGAKELAQMQQAHNLASNAYSRQKGSSIYKVDIPDEQIAKMLDYDKAIQEQPEILKYARSTLPEDVLQHFDNNVKSGISGANVYKNWVWGAGKSDIDTSEALRQAGIPGIRYLDNGSRGGIAGTSNYVVFPGNEDMLTILERNNQPLVNALRSK